MEHRVKLTFYGGINKVGGNKVLLEDLGYDVKIFLDFGINTSEFSKFRKDFPYTNEIKTLTDCHVLPREIDIPIKNIYSKYFIFNHTNTRYPQKVKEFEGIVDPPTDLD